LFYGDEGKGSIVDYLVREYEATQVVRYNGGPQAAHHVVTDDGQHHRFSQWGAGTFVPGVKTYLSRYMLINPVTMLMEEEHLREVGIDDAWSRLTIDPRCIVITPWHAAVQCVRERMRADRHGTTGHGVDEAMRDMMRGHIITAADIWYGNIRAKLEDNRARMVALAIELGYEPGGYSEGRGGCGGGDEPEYDLDDLDSVNNTLEIYRHIRSHEQRVYIRDELCVDNVIVMEGAQGVLLDECLGTQPHTTWGRTTFANAMQIANEHEMVRVGVMRPYLTRHGAGPFEEDEAMTKYVLAHGEHNEANEWQGPFRCGELPLRTLKYVADAIGSLDVLAVSCLDHIPPGNDVDTYIENWATIFGTKTVLESRGPTASDKIWSNHNAI
jgi:adenylosuccinate synthase